MNAYDKDYLPDAMTHMGTMLDYAVRCCGIALREFYNRFINSNVAHAIETGHPRFLAGLSGQELAAITFRETGGSLQENIPYSFPWEDSSLLWTGEALCRYQWHSSRSFAALDRGGITVEWVHSIFIPYHEAPVEKFLLLADERFRGPSASLKEHRKLLGITQEELAERSGVSLRMIRAYEQGQQPLSRAETATVLALSRTLHCSPASLVEG